MKYYWCVNCGFHGEFNFYRQKNIKCQICEYEHLTEFTEDEYNEWSKYNKKIQDEDIFYKSGGQIKGAELMKKLGVI